MRYLITCLLALLFSMSSPAVGVNIDFGHSSLAANRVGYHATHADVVPLIQQNGFRAGTAPGRLGSGGTYVNSSPQRAIAEFAHHNPGVTPSVLKVQYNPGINASTTVAPRNYVEVV
jgi:hypothetical protein